MNLFTASTICDKSYPKKKFYENVNIDSAMKRFFIEQIKSIRWKNKLAQDTLNISKGAVVSEINVFEINLHGTELDESILRQIDTMVPYHFLFLLVHDNLYQAWIAYKEKLKENGRGVFRVKQYYHTDWMSAEELPLRIKGFDLDDAYESFIMQINPRLVRIDAGESFKNLIERCDKIDQLNKKISQLQKKMNNEKQLNRQMEISSKIKLLKMDLEKLE